MVRARDGLDGCRECWADGRRLGICGRCRSRLFGSGLKSGARRMALKTKVAPGMSYLEVAETLESFIEGRGGRWDWNDYISAVSFDDGYLKRLQARMDGLSNEFPAG